MTLRRVLFHNHSTWSDGRMALRTVARLGEYFGASAVVMSEHDYEFSSDKWDQYVDACRQASTQACVIIPGIEYSSSDDDIHIVTVGTPDFHGARRNLIDTIMEVRAQGGAAIFAHPRRRDCFKKLSRDLLAVLDGVEIWNRKADGLLPDKGYFNFARSHGLAATVGMDLHTWRQVFPMWNRIDAPPGPLDGRIVATALRQRQIEPACILGELHRGLESGFSVSLGLLASAERVRCALRRVRDAIHSTEQVKTNGETHSD